MGGGGHTPQGSEERGKSTRQRCSQHRLQKKERETGNVKRAKEPKPSSLCVSFRLKFSIASSVHRRLRHRLQHAPRRRKGGASRVGVELRVVRAQPRLLLVEVVAGSPQAHLLRDQRVLLHARLRARRQQLVVLLLHAGCHLDLRLHRARRRVLHSLLLRQHLAQDQQVALELLLRHLRARRVVLRLHVHRRALALALLRAVQLLLRHLEPVVRQARVRLRRLQRLLRRLLRRLRRQVVGPRLHLGLLALGQLRLLLLQQLHDVIEPLLSPHRLVLRGAPAPGRLLHLGHRCVVRGLLRRLALLRGQELGGVLLHGLVAPLRLLRRRLQHRQRVALAPLREAHLRGLPRHLVLARRDVRARLGDGCARLRLLLAQGVERLVGHLQVVALLLHEPVVAQAVVQGVEHRWVQLGEPLEVGEGHHAVLVRVGLHEEVRLVLVQLALLEHDAPLVRVHRPLQRRVELVEDGHQLLGQARLRSRHHGARRGHRHHRQRCRRQRQRGHDGQRRGRGRGDGHLRLRLRLLRLHLLRVRGGGGGRGRVGSQQV
eukprot:Rhum_TRINITY_DN9198_c0_g1::Rhum_TRINITY_DN9198_c0_g1_i1::g.32041::m.32041